MREASKYELLKSKASKGPFVRTDINDLYGKNDQLVFSCYSDCGKNDAQEKANAQLIAHTLNTYDQLLEALEAVEGATAKNYYAETEAVCEDDNGLYCCLNIKAVYAVEQALKAAKEVAQ